MEFLPSTPPHPPPTEEDAFVWLRLLRSRRVGPTTFHRLMAEHGTASDALAALPKIAAAAGISDYATCPPAVVRAELEAGHAVGARPLLFLGPGYPKALAEIADAPPVLWVRGDIGVLSRPSVGLVGARNASSLGLRMARSLADGIGRAGHATVSGLARGIDTEVHRATLYTGTVAVMAGGIDVIYPAENADLAARIIETGCLVSEQPIGLKPQARHFPRRNRLISGISHALVVVEAAAKSGSLITARDALDQGREVLAVPGHPFDARAAGCNLLIRDGATLVRGPADVLAALPDALVHAPRRTATPAPAVAPAAPAPPASGRIDDHVLERLGPSPMSEDQLLRDLGLPAGQVSDCLTRLELDGLIERDGGGLLRRAG
ncbi:DNA-processing protein DprA [Palleronia sp.]|uniref:DNA-processing protein DprA n=1 Tax=Palleronia sp. TaxID=1940284 RepID=UPI0035C7E92B